jgi:hypothetical protein
MKSAKLIREITIEPAFDKRSTDPNKNYGIHGCNLRFVLKGPLGAVQFLLMTNWQLPHVTEEFLKRPVQDETHLRCFYLPLPADLGYHSPKPTYKGQKSMGPCEYLDGKPCYYDGSGLNAEPVYERMLKEGSKGVWAELEDYYKSTFERDPK